MWEATLVFYPRNAFVMQFYIGSGTDRKNMETLELQGRETQPGCLSASHWHLNVIDSLNILTSSLQ